MDYYSVIKRNEVLTHAVTHMDHEHIVLIKSKKPITKTTYCIIPFIHPEKANLKTIKMY